MSRAHRVGRVERATKETSVLVEIDLDGTGKGDLATGVGSTSWAATGSST